MFDPADETVADPSPPAPAPEAPPAPAPVSFEDSLRELVKQHPGAYETILKIANEGEVAEPAPAPEITAREHLIAVLNLMLSAAGAMAARQPVLPLGITDGLNRARDHLNKFAGME